MGYASFEEIRIAKGDSGMDFSINTQEKIASTIAEEISKLLGKEDVKDLVSLENSIRSALKETGRQVYKKVLEKADEAYGKGISCSCGRQAQRISRRDVKLLTIFGWVSYRRSYYGCQYCGEKAFPLDQAWQVHPGEASPVMNKLLAIAGVEVAFERARSHLAEFLMVDVSDNTIRKYTQEMGARQAAAEAGWIKKSQSERWLQSRESKLKNIPDRLYGSMDGVQVPVGKEWRELKTLTWYQVAPIYGQEKERSQEISYHCEIAPAEKFGDLLWATGLKRFADKAKELILFVMALSGYGTWFLITSRMPFKSWIGIMLVNISPRLPPRSFLKKDRKRDGFKKQKPGSGKEKSRKCFVSAKSICTLSRLLLLKQPLLIFPTTDTA